MHMNCLGVRNNSQLDVTFRIDGQGMHSQARAVH